MPATDTVSDQDTSKEAVSEQSNQGNQREQQKEKLSKLLRSGGKSREKEAGKQEIEGSGSGETALRPRSMMQFPEREDPGSKDLKRTVGKVQGVMTVTFIEGQLPKVEFVTPESIPLGDVSMNLNYLLNELNQAHARYQAEMIVKEAKEKGNG